jgi:hypothetical protein
MGQRLFAIAAVLSSVAVEAWTALGSLITIDVRTYQPEKYYMRGPGPKWNEKFARGRDSALS